MYRIRLYCWAILNGGRFGDLRTIYQSCRALPFALAGLSCRICHTTDSESKDITQVETGCFSMTMPTNTNVLRCLPPDH